MNDPLNAEENAKNIYVIKHKLSELQLKPGMNCYNYHVGKFIVRIFTPKSRKAVHSTAIREHERITNHKEVTVNLYEIRNMKDLDYNHIGTYENPINLGGDERFKNYEPIKVKGYYDSRGKMSLIQLCELIRYLYRLSNLTAFL
jgi:hypothetical protein